MESAEPKTPKREKRTSARESHEAPWLLFIHQIPPKPAYFRAKVGRRLLRLGAAAVKSTVYVLPRNAQTQEDFQWLAKEVVAEGGEATVCVAGFIEGLSDNEVETLFRSARDAEYREIAEAARLARTGEELSEGRTRESEFARLRRRFSEVAAIDFFQAPERVVASDEIAKLETAVRGKNPPSPSGDGTTRREVVGRTWVTRSGVHVDRIASAWLIRRFVDANATFKFVPPKGYEPVPGELRFDMFEAEFMHEGDECSFEVLRRRLGIGEAGLSAIAEIIHDIDIKDGKFGRAETPGVASMIAGLALRHRDDEARLDRGFALLDDLLAYFERKDAA